MNSAVNGGVTQLLASLVQTAQSYIAYLPSHIAVVQSPVVSLVTHPVDTALALVNTAVNWAAWVIFGSGATAVSVTNAAFANIGLTTTLLYTLIPAIPTTYPDQLIRVDVEALVPPSFSFDVNVATAVNVSLVGALRTTVYVDNVTLGNPLILKVDSNFSLSGKISPQRMVECSICI